MDGLAIETEFFAIPNVELKTLVFLTGLAFVFLCLFLLRGSKNKKVIATPLAIAAVVAEKVEVDVGSAFVPKQVAAANAMPLAPLQTRPPTSLPTLEAAATAGLPAMRLMPRTAGDLQTQHRGPVIQFG